MNLLSLGRLSLGMTVLLLLGSIASPAPISAAEGSSVKPNIVLIMTDDQGHGDLSGHGNKILKTPVLDKLARASVQFDRFFVCAVCAPTRSQLLTGRYHLRGGVWGVTKGRETLDADAVTLAELLKPAGYATGLFGKWHLGESYPNVPHGQGFDRFVGFRTGHWNLYFNPPLEENGQPIETLGYITDVITDYAIDFIRDNRDKPFFCYVAYNAPHAPIQIADEYFDVYKDDKIDAFTKGVYGMVANIDENVGRLLKKIDELQLTEKTIVIFLTDNGPNGDRFNSGMRGRKGSLYEGGVRVPCFIRWPGHLKPHTVHQTASAIDMVPTLLDLCGVKPADAPKFDGKSLTPLLLGNDHDWPERKLFFHRSRDSVDEKVNRYPGAVRTQNYRLYLKSRNQVQLYDLTKDPGEKNNIVKQHPAIVKELKSAYEKWFDDVTDRRFVSPVLPVGYDEENPVTLPATRAWFTGKIHYFGKNGYAHDWLSFWTNTSDQLGWKVDVVNPGTYEVQLHYICKPGNEGCTVQLISGDDVLATKIEKPYWPKAIKVNNRAPRDVPEMPWKEKTMGRITLKKGKATLVLSAKDKKGPGLIDVQDITLKKVGQ